MMICYMIYAKGEFSFVIPEWQAYYIIGKLFDSPFEYHDKNKMWLWNMDAPDSKKVELRQNSQSPTFLPRPTTRGTQCH